jgi:outer membrane protein assembly factor BamB
VRRSIRSITLVAVVALAGIAIAVAVPWVQAAAKAAPAGESGGTGAVAMGKGISALPSVGGGTAKAGPEDCPQWRGPNRDGVFAGKGLMQEWPADGPKALWKIRGLGNGFSGPSIAGGRVYIMGTRSGDDYTFCFDLATQRPLWQTRLGKSELDGPRCNPAVDSKRVYSLTTAGDLACMDTETGRIVWAKNLHKDFHGRLQGDYGYCESPLVDGDKVLVTPGGVNDAMMVALNKETGETIWKFAMPDFGDAGHNGSGYSSIVVSEGAGVRQYVQHFGPGICGVRASDGKFLWGYGRVSQGHSNIPTPVAIGDYVFTANAYGGGACLLKLKPNPNEKNGAVAEEVWRIEAGKFECTSCQMVVVGDYVYSGHGTRSGEPICVEFLTGKVMWMTKQPGPGTGGVAFADGRLIYHYADGTTCLVEPSPEKFKVISQFKAAEGSHTIPVIADGKLFVRKGDVLGCYDLKKR